MTQMLEFSATVFGLLQGVFVLLNKRSNWLFYIAQMGCLICFSAKNNLFGDVMNCSIYLVLGIIGYFYWTGGKSEKKITSCGTREKIFYTAVIFAATVALHYCLRNTKDPLPLLDSFTTTSSMVATLYMIAKKTDTWLIWFVNDIVYVVEYANLATPAYYLIALNSAWAIMAVCSYFYWLKLKERQKDEENIFCRKI